jgi:hypothetical protein
MEISLGDWRGSRYFALWTGDWLVEPKLIPTSSESRISSIGDEHVLECSSDEQFPAFTQILHA